jgi:hypothetical protein
VMLLVFSSHANGSPQISREVERAVSKGLVVVPVRIEDIKPTGNLEYFLGTPHWLDAITPPFERHLDYIADSAKFWLARIESDSPRPSDDTRPQAASLQPARDERSILPPAPARAHAPARSKRIVSAIAAALLVVLGTAGYFGARYYVAQQEAGRERAVEQATAAERAREAAQQREQQAAAAERERASEAEARKRAAAEQADKDAQARAQKATDTEAKRKRLAEADAQVDRIIAAIRLGTAPELAGTLDPPYVDAIRDAAKAGNSEQQRRLGDLYLLGLAARGESR